MRPTLWIDVKRILGEAVDMPRARREAHVRARATDPAVRSEVLRLLDGRERLAAATGTATTVRRGPGRGLDASRDPAADAARPDVGPGSTIGGRYELGERIGVGTFGAVHRATDRVTGDAVAVKLVTVVGETDASALRREVSVLRRSRLPGIVELLDEGVEGGRAYIVMRLVEGCPFPGAACATAPEWSDLAPKALALVEALGRLHWLGVLHRDVKPENVIVGADGRVTIVDLGVAHDASGAVDVAAGCIVGTPLYLAPERLLGGPATVAGDLYAVGVILYEVLARRPVRASGSLQELLAHCGDVPASLRETAPGVPAHVAETIDALVHPDPARRPPSARVAAAMLRGHGTAGSRVRLPPLGAGPTVAEESLRALFAGHDRLFHLREDGARELWRRTLGAPDEVAREVEVWVESGIARWEDDRIVIDRSGLERLESRVWSALPHVRAPDGLARPDVDVAAVLEIAGCALPVAALARALGRSAADVGAAVDRLASCGLARVGRPGVAEATRSIDAAAQWSASRRRDAHLAVAASLAVATDRRLFHLIAADAVDDVPPEALAVGRGLYREGRIEAAMLAAAAGLAAARAGGAAAAVVDELLALLVEAALAGSSPDTLDRAAVEVARAPQDTPTRRTLARVCAGGRLVLLGSHERALAETDEAEPGTSERAAQLRSVVRSFAASFLAETEPGRRALAESFAWARRHGGRTGVACAREWLGWRRYRQQRYASAAWLHLRCAESHRNARSRITALTNAASAFLEGFQFGKAAEFAETARRLAAAHRLPTHEARAGWVGRAAAYRSGVAPDPDPELVAALQDGITPAIAGVALLVEAAILRRRGRDAEAAAVARDSARIAKRANHASVEAIALGLAAAAGRGLDGASRERFIAQTQRVTVDAVRCQALALFVSSGPDSAEQLPQELLRGVRLRPKGVRSAHVQDVLSEAEWSEILENVPGVPGGEGGLHVRTT